jgi:hypothetical protein
MFASLRRDRLLATHSLFLRCLPNPQSANVSPGCRGSGRHRVRFQANLETEGQVLLAVILAFTKDFHASPSPIDAVGLNESVLDFHHLDEVHLFAVWSLSRVLPRHPAPVGEEPLAVVLPLVRSAGDDFGKKRTKLVVPMCDTPTIENVGGDRTFQCRVDGIAGQQRVHIMVCQRVFPGPGDRFNFLVRFRSYNAHLPT